MRLEMSGFPSTGTVRRYAVLAVGAAGLVASVAHAAPVPGRGTWETTLLARDINSDGTVDAYYDTVLDLSWLADINAAAGTVYDTGFSNVDGRLTWANANAWAANLDVYGVSGWRMPTLLVGTSVSEISRMYYETLGNFGPGNPLTMTPPGTWGFTNTGPFQNLVSQSYWLDVPPENPMIPETISWFGDSISAYHSVEPITVQYRAWAVRSGDVAPIPEPSTYALMLAGLAVVVWASRRQR